jgi:cell wall-associated NlpC family hydrolase
MKGTKAMENLIIAFNVVLPLMLCIMLGYFLSRIGMIKEELRKGIVEAALSYLGVQYRWGGRTPAGVDCSGLCFMAYRLNGLTIWRDADVDRNPHLRKIPLEEAKPGDMMFFPGHVAMYLGNGEFVHSAATPGMVVRDTIANAPGLMARLSCVATYF